MRSRNRILAALFICIAATLLGMLHSRTHLLRSLLKSTPGFSLSFSSSYSSSSFLPLSAFMSPSSPPEPKPVVVVGSGLAGLAAAYTALQSGAPAVHVLDRAPKPGGNSIKASSGINGAGTRFQKAAGVGGDTNDSFFQDTKRSAGRRFQEATEGCTGLKRVQLIEKLTSESADAVTWLVDELGVDLSVVAPLGGHSVARTHRGAGGTTPGFAIISALLKKLGENPRFTLHQGAEVKALSLSDCGGGVKGVRYVQDVEEKDLEGAIVFAAGGFGGDATGLLAKHRPDLAGVPSTNDARPGAHAILTKAGAALVDMDSVQVHPTGFVDPASPSAPYKILAAEALRGEGGILLDDRGRRFVNEMATRDVVTAAMMAQEPQEATVEGDTSTRQWPATLLLDQGACEAAAGHLGFYTWKGLMTRTKVRDLPQATIEAVDTYASAVAAGVDSAHGRRDFGRWTLPAGEANRDAELCVGRVTPVVHFTMGGAALDAGARVLRADGTVIRGLWAAGEITGGVHGDNRLGGSSLLECVVFGRVAGKAAAEAAGKRDCGGCKCEEW